MVFFPNFCEFLKPKNLRSNKDNKDSTDLADCILYFWIPGHLSPERLHQDRLELNRRSIDSFITKFSEDEAIERARFLPAWLQYLTGSCVHVG